MSFAALTEQFLFESYVPKQRYIIYIFRLMTKIRFIFQNNDLINANGFHEYGRRMRSREYKTIMFFV